MQKFITSIKNLASFFRRRGGDERSLMEKMRDQYRLVVMNDDTFEEVTSLKLTPLAVYAALSSLIVGTAIMVTFLIIWTPLKRYIPGYGDFQRDAEIGGGLLCEFRRLPQSAFITLTDQQSTKQRACSGNADLLSQNRAYRRFERIQPDRKSQTGMSLQQRLQPSVGRQR